MNDTEKVNVSATFFGTVEVPKGASEDEIEVLVCPILRTTVSATAMIWNRNMWRAEKWTRN